MKDWAEIIAEFECMARRVQIMAKQRDDDDLRQLAARLTKCADDMRRDAHVETAVVSSFSQYRMSDADGLEPSLV